MSHDYVHKAHYKYSAVRGICGNLPNYSRNKQGVPVMTIYLYIKTHNKTGLKYLGKTKSKDPHKYTGSGKYWKLHLDKHGYDYETSILLVTEDKNELKETGLFFSKIFGVVQSDEWANLKEENGEGGNPIGKNHFRYGKTLTQSHKEKLRKPKTKEHKLHMSQNHADFNGEKNPFFGKTHTEETKAKIGNRDYKIQSGSKHHSKRKMLINDIIYENVTDARNKLKMNQYIIYSILRGETEGYNGHFLPW